MARAPSIYHCTPEPCQFFGRAAELALLDRTLQEESPSLVAMVGPGGQGKTAIVQTWLEPFRRQQRAADGVFFWSFYRGKDVDLCLREMFRYAEGLDRPPDVSAGYCVDHLLPIWRRERWVIILDGTEVVQHETGSWRGRFVHPELGRLLEELASEPAPGVAVVTTRFPLPTLERRKHAHHLSLHALDSASAVALLGSLGARGETVTLEQAAAMCGHHAKAVELLATYLVEFHGGVAEACSGLPEITSTDSHSDEEAKVARILVAYQQALSQESKDILALAAAFRQPPTEERLLQYFQSAPVLSLLHQSWKRTYRSFAQRESDFLPKQIDKLVQLRLLERVHSGISETGAELVIDTHPLVRRGFENVLGAQGQQQTAQARAGFLHGRPDRRPPQSLAEAREEVELFHAYCDAGMWNEADSVYVALDNPKHRFLAPAFERDLLVRFFPGGDSRQKSLWPGFGRWRSLAICFELLGQFEDALRTYPPDDQPLRGDALIALGQLSPLLQATHVEHTWQNLWQSYRVHALCLAGRTTEAVRLAATLIPVDVYEWVHVFECLLRTNQLEKLDVKSMLYRPPHSNEHRWSQFARQRMRLDYSRILAPDATDLGREYEQLIEEFDRGGMPFERGLARLSFGRWLLSQRQSARACIIAQQIINLAQRQRMMILTADGWELLADASFADAQARQNAQDTANQLRALIGYAGPSRN